MSVIDYFAIEKEIESILKAGLHVPDIGPVNITFEVEDMSLLNLDNMPWVGIFLDTTDTPFEREQIGSNAITTILNLEIMIYECADSIQEACFKRNRILSKIKEVLKNNRTLTTVQVLFSWFSSVQFDTAKEGSSVSVGASLRFHMEVRE